MDKDIELQKIEIIGNYFDNEFNAASSNTFNLFITLLAVLLTTYYGIVFNFDILAKLGVIPVEFGFLVAVLALYFIIVKVRSTVRERYDHDKYLALVTGWHKEIEKGNELPSLSEMKKQIMPKEKKGRLNQFFKTSLKSA